MVDSTIWNKFSHSWGAAITTLLIIQSLFERRGWSISFNFFLCSWRSIRTALNSKKESSGGLTVYLHNIKTNVKITLAFPHNGVDNVSEGN